MTRKALVAGSAALAASSLLFIAQAADNHEVIERLMKDYHKAPEGVDPVTKKVGKGIASEAELKALLNGYETIAGFEPPHGDAESWKEKTGAVIVALNDLMARKEGAEKAFETAVNCKACHNVHKP